MESRSVSKVEFSFMTLLRPGRAGLSDMAYENIKLRLLQGEVAPDQWLAIDEIAAQLNVSRQPVMDAVKRLSMEGLLEIVPQVGCRLRQHSEQEIRDFFCLFAAGEGLIAQLLVSRASADDRTKLKLISAQIGELAKSRSADQQRSHAYRALNRQLHAEMRRMISSGPIAEIVEGLGDRADFYVNSTSRLMFAKNMQRAHAEHEAILAAVDAGDGPAARRAMEAHILLTEARIHEAPRPRVKAPRRA